MNPTGGGPGLTLDPPILAANPARGSPPSADRRLPKGATLRVRRRSTLDGARERGSSTMIDGSRLSLDQPVDFADARSSHARPSRRGGRDEVHAADPPGRRP